MALENAGFGIQFCDISRDYGGELFGSEVPVQTETAEAAEAAVEEIKAPIVEETIAETAPTMDTDSAPAEQPVVETTAPVVEETPELHVVPPQQEEAAEEVAEQSKAATYTADMDVSEITQRMTVDEAKAVVVQIGTCRGWTLEQVAQPPGEPQMVSLRLRSGGQHSQSRSIRPAGQSAAESRMKRQVWMKGCGRYQSRFFAVSVPHYRYCGAAAAQYPQARPGLSVCGLPAAAIIAASST